ncbi:MAG: YraN family protein [Planctomycetia bacterium]|nr:YraN family protein [Planctomycetia bacterium]
MIPFFRKRTLEPDFPPELLTEDGPLGRRGETLACWFLTCREHLTLQARNAVVRLSPTNRRIAGELDLILRDERRGELVFVEVRTRDAVSERFGTPADSVDRAKRVRVCHAARMWMKQNAVPDTQPVRFDVISIVWPPGCPPELEHWPRAFGWTK